MQRYTDLDRAALAQALLGVRPAIIPGTRVIANDARRNAYYALVTAAAELTCRCGHTVQDARDAAVFFDACEIPE
jgi:hypothetical protein